MISNDIKARIERELIAAEDARNAGNEAKARVCARRAAGLAIETFYHSHGHPLKDSSAISSIRALQADAQANPGWKEIAGLLLTRVNEDYSFPSQLDVIGETRRLIAEIENSLKGSTLERE